MQANGEPGFSSSGRRLRSPGRRGSLVVLLPEAAGRGGRLEDALARMHRETTLLEIVAVDRETPPSAARWARDHDIAPRAVTPAGALVEMNRHDGPVHLFVPRPDVLEDCRLLPVLRTARRHAARLWSGTNAILAWADVHNELDEQDGVDMRPLHADEKLIMQRGVDLETAIAGTTEKVA